MVRLSIDYRAYFLVDKHVILPCPSCWVFKIKNSWKLKFLEDKLCIIQYGISNIHGVPNYLWSYAGGQNELKIIQTWQKNQMRNESL